MHLEMSVTKIMAHRRLSKLPNLIEMISNMIYIVALGDGFKCSCKIHLNTQWKGNGIVIYGNLMEQVLHLILPKSGRAIIPPAPWGPPVLFLMINRILAKTDCIISHFHIPGHLGLCSILYMISRIFVCRYFSYLFSNRLEKVK